MFVRLVVKQTLGETAAGGNGDRSQLDGTGIIADGVNTRNVGILEFIDDDIAFIVGYHSGSGEIEVIGCRFATDRPNQAVHGLAAAIFQLQGQAAVGVLHYRFRNGMGMQLRAFGVHHLNQRFNDQRIEAT